MDTKQIAGVRSVFYFDALSKEAREKARDWYREGKDDPMLGSHLCNLIGEELDERGYTYGGNAEKDIDVRYSLSYCQGDGLSFVAEVSKDGKTYKITQSGSYSHEMTMNAVEVLEDGEEEDAPQVLEEMREVAKKIRDAGYAEIEYQNSTEYVDEAINANEYTFTDDGKRLDADSVAV